MDNTKTPQHKKTRGRDLVHRYPNNPLLDIDDLTFQCSDIHNAGVVRLQNKLILLVTIEGLAGRRAIHLAHPGPSGTYHVDEHPFLSPSDDPKYAYHESHGVLDARVTYLDNQYYIMYNAHGDHGYRLGLAQTKDFTSVERIGLISEPDTKAGALFPEKIKGRFARLERPASGSSIWISYSHDLLYWGDQELIISPRDGFWDSSRIGVGAPPMKISEGWLLLYYGARDTSAGPIYRIGAVILDTDNPTQVIGRANIPVLSPRETYERIGDVPNIIFSTGAVIQNNGEICIIYGAANSCICLGTTTVQDIVKHCAQSREEF